MQLAVGVFGTKLKAERGGLKEDGAERDD